MRRPLALFHEKVDSCYTALDYPPFFAYFERFLSIPASFIDSKIVNLYNLNYDAWSVVAYQRSTVILTEVVLGVAALRSVEQHLGIMHKVNLDGLDSFVDL